ncbi:MAG: hypothetical protein WC755_08740 [Candidatus Woesearchaeota archaeon]|jgi:hypothetical protein
MNLENVIIAIILVILLIVIIKYTSLTKNMFPKSWEEFIPVSNDPIFHTSSGQNKINIDSDDLEYSDFDNISLAEDIDSLQQRNIGLDFPDNNTGIDNSDLVDQIVSHGDTVFQPAHGIGVSDTTNASMNSFTLGSPSNLPFFDDMSVYDSPTNGQLNIDEKLAISQQHRGSIARKAVEGYVRSTRNLFQKYFTDELNENSNRIWWDDSADENLENDFGPDISPF